MEMYPNPFTKMTDKELSKELEIMHIMSRSDGAHLAQEALRRIFSWYRAKTEDV